MDSILNFPYSSEYIENCLNSIIKKKLIISDNDIKRIIQYAESGGRIIASQEAGRLIDHGETRDANPLTLNPNILYIQDNPNWERILGEIKEYQK